MYLKRKIDTYLKEWKNSPKHMPLIIKGARQIGKTKSILNFADNEYDNVVYINFALEKKFKTIVDDGYDVESIIKNISFLDPTIKFNEPNTLIIFDEIQDYPDIATSLKSFCLDSRFDVICSGSMLGINYKKIHSNSVGYKTDYEMCSMDFEEFLWALNYTEEQINIILENMLALKPFTNLQFDLFRRLFLDYCVLGGMPAIVSSYIENKNFSDTLNMQNQINLDYEEDVRKYASGLDQAKIISVYRNIPVQLAKENKKFQYSLISKSARSREYSGCIEWLSDAGIVNMCYCLNFPELPLKGNYDEDKFKLYVSDTGLLIASLDQEAQDDLRANQNLGVYKGALYENFIAEALKKQNYGLYYYKKDDGVLEQDFFIRSKNELVPIEVKANSGKAKSMTTLINNPKYKDIKHGIKFSNNNIGFDNSIITFPYFCAFMLRRYMERQKIML